jgi:CHAT domain-containing protein
LRAGSRCYANGKLSQALSQYLRALELAAELRDRDRQAFSLYRLSLVFGAMGREGDAAHALERAFDIARGEGNEVAMEYAAKALLEIHLGRHPEPWLHVAQELVDMARERGDVVSEGAGHGMLANFYDALGEHDNALRAAQDALEISKGVRDPGLERHALFQLGMAYGNLGRHDDALEQLEKALALSRRLRNRKDEGATLNGIGLIQTACRRYEEAVTSFAALLALARKQRDWRLEEHALNNLGIVELDGLHRFEDARRHLEHALRIDRAHGDLELAAPTLCNLALVCAELGLTDEARAYFEEAIPIFEELRGEIISEELRSSFFAQVEKAYREYAVLLAREADYRGAIHIAERGRARGLLDLLAEAAADLRGTADSELLDREQYLLQELKKIAARLLRGGSPKLEREKQRLELSYQALQAEIRMANPRYAALAQLQAWTAEEIQEQLLDDQTALLEYVLADQGSLLIVVFKNRLAAFPLPPRAEIEQLVRELRAAVKEDRLTRYPHGHELYQALLAPAAELIRGRKLLIVADGVLHYLPFGLLLSQPPDEQDASGPAGHKPRRTARPEDERELLDRLTREMHGLPAFDWERLPYVLREHAIAYAPSATVAGLLRREAARRSASGEPYDLELAVFADPETEAIEGCAERGEKPVALNAALGHVRGPAGLPRLPGTADEAWQLAQLFSPEAVRSGDAYDDKHVRLRCGSRATKKSALALATGEQRFRFLHLATHGLLDEETPRFSGLVFSPGEQDDPYWQVLEIFNARLRCECACLSACETGLGRVISGEGMIGLSRAFLHAGACSVCVSLWLVQDVSAPPLMRAFYEHVLAGLGKAEALRQAQLDQIAGGVFMHPKHWAPFILIGETSS